MWRTHGVLLITLGSVLASSTVQVAGSGNVSHGLRGAVGPLTHLLQAAAVPADPNVAGGNVVTIDFFYGPACGNCLNFMRLALIPLLEAGLPGGRVRLSVLPFIRIEDNIPVDMNLWNSYCRASDVCYYALAPICALKVNVPAAAPVDNPELGKAVHFAECNQARRLASHPDSRLQVTPEMQTTEDAESRQCASQVGVLYDGPGGIKACADGPESMTLIHSPGYTNRIRHFEHLLKQSGEQQMPYIFINQQEVLRCDESSTGVDCSGSWTPPGTDRQLQHGGSLLHLVCARLQPPPPQCAGVSAKRAKIGPTPKCENCAEVGSFHMSPPIDGVARSHRRQRILGAVAAAAGAVVALAWVARRRSKREVHVAPEEESSGSELLRE